MLPSEIKINTIKFFKKKLNILTNLKKLSRSSVMRSIN
jgi:hypothetical protein